MQVSFFACGGCTARNLNVYLCFTGISSSQFAAACVIVDKLDKLPEDAVLEELLTKCGIASEQGKQLFALMKVMFDV